MVYIKSNFSSPTVLSFSVAIQCCHSAFSRSFSVVSLGCITYCKVHMELLFTVNYCIFYEFCCLHFRLCLKCFPCSLIIVFSTINECPLSPWEFPSGFQCISANCLDPVIETDFPFMSWNLLLPLSCYFPQNKLV